jgi:hypothetical protein
VDWRIRLSRILAFLDGSQKRSCSSSAVKQSEILCLLRHRTLNVDR